MKVNLSFIIVNYKADDVLLECVKSINSANISHRYEIIIIDNFPNSRFKKNIHLVKNVKYVLNKKNVGFGAANNQGAKIAQGKFLYFLNPDTSINENGTDYLLSLFLTDKNLGIAAPLLHDKNNRVYPLQGTTRLNPLNAMIALSFINKVFPNNPISRRYWLADWNKKNARTVDVMPGTAFLMKRELFNKVGGFDTKFFLYFEENDLANRVIKEGYTIKIIPKARVFHAWGVSTRKKEGIQAIFNESRDYYFKKYYGNHLALLVRCVLSVNKYTIVLLLIILIAIFLRIDRISTLMMFIGDQGWFYISARNLLINGEVPIIGIQSSRLWLHQGPLWTYMLALPMYIFKFDPVSGAYLAVLFGILSTTLIYKVGKLLITREFGLIASSLYAVSPLIVIHERMAYHTSPISFFTILYTYALTKWIRGNVYYFPFALFVLSLLYNLELAIVVLWPPVIIFLLYGIYKRKKWAINLKTKKMMTYSAIGFLIPMLPIIFYDVQNGFPQTIKYSAWIVLQILSIFSLNKDLTNYSVFLDFTFIHLKRLYLLQSVYISIILSVLSIVTLISSTILYRKINLVTISLITVIPLLGYFISHTPSEAYLPMLFPGLILALSYLFYVLLSSRFKILSLALLIFVLISNFVLVVSNNYLMEKPLGYGWPIEKRIEVAKSIINVAGSRPFNLVFKSPTAPTFHSSTLNYEYLIWWMYRISPNHDASLKIIVTERENKIEVSEIKM